MIRRITGQAELLEQMPILQHSIQRRNPYVDPLSFIQLVLLQTPPRRRTSRARNC